VKKSKGLLCILASALALPQLCAQAIPIELNPAGLIVHATINGHPANLIVDTGAVVTTVNPSFLENNAATETISLNTAAGATNVGVHSASVVVGTQQVTTRVLALDTREVSARAGIQIDGFLGLNVLAHSGRFAIDVQKRTLEFK
jgi:predicted aspartyl protease